MRFKRSSEVRRGVQYVPSFRLRLFGLAWGIAIPLLVFSPISCRKPSAPVTLTFLDPEGFLDLGEQRRISDAALQQFTRETGILVNHLPGPEDNGEDFRLARDLLQKGASIPDVYGVDTIWSGALSEYLVDLKPFFASELTSMDPELVASFIVQGKLAAMPYHPNVGVLYYRTDLLRKYGYSAPPRTWDELEQMAVRIQNGERARGQKDFWGFVWPGNVSESVSSDTTELDAGEGGGTTIDADGKITVNNPNVIRAWERAARWVGWISSPDVLSYSDWDASNAFWISGKAAFTRGWSDYFERHPPGEPFRQQAGVTSVPAGKGARVSMLGGYALAVSRSSAHLPEATRLIAFLTRRETQLRVASSGSEPPIQLEFHELPRILVKMYPWAGRPGEQPGGTLVSRPSAVAGAKYDAVSRAYVQAVRSVLTRQSTAQQAAEGLEKELVRITGFEPAHK
jgi:trehalose/maltose transport system substrate-binding protein